MSLYMLLWVVIPAFLFQSGSMIPGGQTGESEPIVRLESGSRIWIEGRSNVNRFECTAGAFEGHAHLRNEPGTDRSTWDGGRIDLSVEITVRSFECGRDRMNRDLYDALRSDEHQQITFRYRDTDVFFMDPQTGLYSLKVIGDLTVAGKTREITFPADGRLLEEGKMRVTGEKLIRMSDYDIEPPTGLLGLVRAEDELNVRFDLIASGRFDQP